MKWNVLKLTDVDADTEDDENVDVWLAGSEFTFVGVIESKYAYMPPEPDVIGGMFGDGMFLILATEGAEKWATVTVVRKVSYAYADDAVTV